MDDRLTKTILEYFTMKNADASTDEELEWKNSVLTYLQEKIKRNYHDG